MTALLPSNLPSIAKAKLPATYEGAKVALAECTRIDECQDWADKAEALASYAKQAQDGELRKMADRIQARAIRRCGELLQQIQAATNQHDAAARAREGTLPTRTQAATEAGLSEHRRKTALRVVRVPDPEFEGAIEGDNPATVTELARRGTQHKPPSKSDQIRALRERQATAGEATPSAQSKPAPDDADELKQVWLMARGGPGRIAKIPREKRIALARACLAILNVTLDDLRAS